MNADRSSHRVQRLQRHVSLNVILIVLNIEMKHRKSKEKHGQTDS